MVRSSVSNWTLRLLQRNAERSDKRRRAVNNFNSEIWTEQVISENNPEFQTINLNELFEIQYTTGLRVVRPVARRRTVLAEARCRRTGTVRARTRRLADHLGAHNDRQIHFRGRTIALGIAGRLFVFFSSRVSVETHAPAPSVERDLPTPSSSQRRIANGCAHGFL